MLEVLKNNLILENGVVKPNESLFLKLKSYNLTERRFIHSLSVAQLCYDVAVSNNLEDPLVYYICGMLHDIGKATSDEESIEIIKKNFDEVNIPKYAYHAYVGVVFARDDFGINENEVLDAIKDHCLGNKDLSSFGKILYACDKIDPKRGYDSQYMIDRMLKDYKEGFVFVLHENLIHLSNKHNISPLDFVRTGNEYSKLCFESYLDLSEFEK